MLLVMRQGTCGMLGLLVVQLVLGASSVHAEVGDELFSDDYSTLDPAFDTDAGGYKVADNSLTYPIDENLYSRVMYQANLFDSIDLSAKVRLEKPDAGQDAVIGITFWAFDASTFYAFRISDFGTFSVVAITPTKWTNPVSWRKSSAIKCEPGDWNELRVVAIGNRARLYINGEVVATIKGKPPEGGSLVGVYRETSAEPSVGFFSAFKVLEPDPTLLPPLKEDPNVILQDSFAELDSAWGSPSNYCDVKDGVLTLTVDPGFAYRQLNGANEVKGDVDISTKVSISGGNDQDVATAAVTLFNLPSGDDYWIVSIDATGQYSVAHFAKTRWLFPVSYRKIPDEAKWVAGEMADLKLSLRGKKLGVSINGAEVIQVNAQPPQESWQFGVYCESGTAKFDDFLVAKPATP